MPATPSDDRSPRGLASELEDYFYQRLEAAITAAPADLRDDLYAISFFTNFNDIDEPAIHVGFGTERQVRRAMSGESGGWGAPEDEDEARWNYAFWSQEDLMVLGGGSSDRAGQHLHEAWMEREGFPAHSGFAEEEMLERLEQAVKDQWRAVAIGAARRLHASGLIEQRFGRPIPILIHELEYYDQSIEDTRAANPAGLADPFCRWIEAM